MQGKPRQIALIMKHVWTALRGKKALMFIQELALLVGQIGGTRKQELRQGHVRHRGRLLDFLDSWVFFPSLPSKVKKNYGKARTADSYM